MQGNIVKAAWILGGALLLCVILTGVGLFCMTLYFSRTFAAQLDVLSKRSADAVLHAPENTKIALRADGGNAIKVGFEPKLPLALRAENSIDDSTGKRAAFEVDVKPTLNK